MSYFLSFLFFLILIFLLGSISAAVFALIQPKPTGHFSIIDIFWLSSFGLIAILLFAFIGNLFLPTKTIFSWPFYALISLFGLLSIWYLKPTFSKIIILFTLLTLGIFCFISPIELSTNSLVSFGGNGDYHNHEKIAKMLNEFSVNDLQLEKIGNQFFSTRDRVSSVYRYPLGSAYLLIFSHNFIDLFISLPHYASLHKFFFAYAFLLASILVYKFFPNRAWSWLIVVLCFSYPPLHVLVGMDFIAQELALWLLVLILFLPSYDKAFKILPLLVLSVGIVYYYWLVVIIPYLVFYGLFFLKNKKWRAILVLLMVSSFLVWHYWPNLQNMREESKFNLEQKEPFFPKINFSHVIGAIPYDINPAYNDKKFLEEATNAYKQPPIIFLLGLLFLLTLTKASIYQKEQRLFFILFALLQIALALFLLETKWRYAAFKFISLYSIMFLPLLVGIFDQSNLLLKKLAGFVVIVLISLFLSTAWTENSDWLRKSNSLLFYSDTFQKVLSNIDKSVVIHRNAHFMSLLSDESLGKNFYSAAFYNLNYSEILVNEADYQQVCNFELLNEELVSGVFVEVGSCVDEKYPEDWEFFNSFNGQVTYYSLNEVNSK